MGDGEPQAPAPRGESVVAKRRNCLRWRIDDDVQMVKEVEALEERIELDEATEDEYLVQNAYEVAVKVTITLPTSAII